MHSLVEQVCALLWHLHQHDPLISITALTLFLVVMTNLILLIGAGLFSRSLGSFQENAYNHLLGVDVDDAGGNGPGSYDVRGNVWHLDCCNPNSELDGEGWTIFNAIFGWTNSATRTSSRRLSLRTRLANLTYPHSVGTVLSYVFYWLAVIVVLVYMKFTEACCYYPFFNGVAYPFSQGRTKLLGRESAAGVRRRQAQKPRDTSENNG